MLKHVSNISLYLESKQFLGCVCVIVFSEVKSPLQGLRGLSGPGVMPCEKCLLQMSRPRARLYPGCFWGQDIVSLI